MEAPYLDAIAAIQERSDTHGSQDRRRLERALGQWLAKADVIRLADQLRTNTRLTLNFHPDRRANNGSTVAAGLASTGMYLPQSLTGISNGGRTAVLGGDRPRWERSLFGPVYDSERVTSPVYGALDVTCDPHGGSPRFGSSFIVLNDSCYDRATFCVGDSHVGPRDVGAAGHMTSILAGLFEQAAQGNALDRPLSLAGLQDMITGLGKAAIPARSLDGYIETQIHGGVSLATDVDTIVLDPSFRDTTTEAHLAQACASFDIDLGWHKGSRLAADDVPIDYRGPAMRPLAQRIAPADGVITAAVIGRSAREIAYSPPTPFGDAPDSPLQHHKQLWHCLLHFGEDAV